MAITVNHSPFTASGGNEKDMAQEKGRRQRYRGRDTLSRMLQDGEKHQVWKPGCQESFKQKTAESPGQRQETLFKRIDTYRSSRRSRGEDVDSEGVASEGVVSGGVVGIMASMQKRMDQWQRIEEEARRAEESEAMQLAEVGGVAEGRVVVEARRESVVSRGSVLSQVMVTIAEEGEEGERKEGTGGRRKEGRRVSWGDKKTGWDECEELVEGEEGEGMDEEEGGVFTITEEEEGRGKGGRRKEGRRVSWGDQKTGWEECEELVKGGEGEEQAMALSNLEKPALESPPQWYKETEI